MKDYREHFFMLYEKLKNNENFAFSRFSDGELYMMQGKETQLADNFYILGNRKVPQKYHEEDHKHFIPEKHEFYRQKLMDSYQHLQDDYFVGLSCRCCVGNKDHQEMLDWYKGDINSDLLTWSNLWVNGNFPKFKELMIPEFSNHDIVYILNENANVDGLPFKVKKDFRVGKNCIINDYDKIFDVGNWIFDNKIENHVFLFSASSLSNYMIHYLYKSYPDNTYIDVGTTMNDLLGMKGLREYIKGNNKKMCIW